MGELHLEIIVDRMKREFGVNCNVGEPQVAYRETLTEEITVEHEHKKQTGGAGQYAKLKMQFTPRDNQQLIGAADEMKKDVEFIDKVRGGVVPKEYYPGVLKGILSVMDGGPVAGFPVMPFAVTLLDGAFHEVDSSIYAFESAARAATRKGLKMGKSRLMEPIMKVDVIGPEECIGDVIGDINARRGQIVELTSRGISRVLSALVPLANMFSYVSHLRSMSKGRAGFTMSLEKYDFVPPNVEKELIEKFKPSGKKEGEEEED